MPQLPSSRPPRDVNRPAPRRMVSRSLMSGGGIAAATGVLVAATGTLPLLGTFGVHPVLLTRVLYFGGAAALALGAVLGRYGRKG